MQLSVELVSTKHLICLPKIETLIKLLFKGADAKISGSSLFFNFFGFDEEFSLLNGFCLVCLVFKLDFCQLFAIFGVLISAFEFVSVFFFLFVFISFLAFGFDFL